MTRHPLFVVAALATFAPSAARAADAPVASDPVFTALAADGSTASGRVRQFAADGSLTLVTEGGVDRVIPFNSLVKLTRETVNAPLTPEASVVLFPGGDRLYRSVIGAATETTLDVQSYALNNLAVPLDSVLGLTLAHSPDADSLAGLVRKLRDEPRDGEVLWLANGDRLTGGFLGLSEKAITFQSGKNSVKLDRTGVLALGFDPKSVNYPEPAGPALDVTFLDGSRLGLVNPRVEQGLLVAATRFAATVRVPLSEVARAHARSKSVVYLAGRTPAADRYVPYIGPPRTFRRDANVEGDSLRLSGKDYDRGLGTQSRTLLAYRLEPGDLRFQATVGLDDRAGPLGSVVFRVLVDGKERFASPPLSARDEPREVDVDLAGAKLLILATEYGDRGGVRDLADWVEARVIR